MAAEPFPGEAVQQVAGVTQRSRLELELPLPGARAARAPVAQRAAESRAVVNRAPARAPADR